MPTTRATKTNGWLTIEDLLHDLGGVAPARIRLQPPPGKATEADLAPDAEAGFRCVTSNS